MTKGDECGLKEKRGKVGGGAWAGVILVRELQSLHKILSLKVKGLKD